MNRRKCQSLYGSRWSFLLILFSAEVLLCSGGILQATTAAGDLNVDISVKSRPLKEVVNLVQKQTGYTVELKSIDESFPVTGNYSDTEVENIYAFIERVQYFRSNQLPGQIDFRDFFRRQDSTGRGA